MTFNYRDMSMKDTIIIIIEQGRHHNQVHVL